MTIREFCKSFTREMDEHRLIIVSSLSHCTLADSDIVLLYNFRLDQDELCVTMHRELLDVNCDNVAQSETAVTITTNDSVEITSLPQKVVLCTCSRRADDDV